MLGPTLWSGTPYGNRTALSDFAGTLELWFRGLADEIFDLTGETITVLPIGTRFGPPESLEAVQSMSVSAAISTGSTPCRSGWKGWTPIRGCWPP